MQEEKKLIFSQETLDTYFEASLMRGIGLKKLSEKKEKYASVVVFVLFYLKRFFSNKKPTRDDLTHALDIFLTEPGCWLEDSPENLLERLVNAGGFEEKEGGHYKILLKVNGQWTIEKAFTYLDEKEFSRDQKRKAIQEALQEKNRTINSKKVPVSALRDRKFMRLALRKANEALLNGEIPVGAVLVTEDGEILSETHNQVLADKCVTSHAEMLAIQEASKKVGRERLAGTTLYVTLEPCPMCAAAILHARISRVVWGAEDLKAGAFGGAFDLESRANLNWHVEKKGGVLKKDCEKVLNDFFKAKRTKKKVEL